MYSVKGIAEIRTAGPGFKVFVEDKKYIFKNP